MRAWIICWLLLASLAGATFVKADNVVLPYYSGNTYQRYSESITLGRVSVGVVNRFEAVLTSTTRNFYVVEARLGVTARDISGHDVIVKWVVADNMGNVRLLLGTQLYAMAGSPVTDPLPFVLGEYIPEAAIQIRPGESLGVYADDAAGGSNWNITFDVATVYYSK